MTTVRAPRGRLIHVIAEGDRTLCNRILRSPIVEPHDATCVKCLQAVARQV